MADSTQSHALHFRILEDIAKDLSGDTRFPVCLEACIAVRDALSDPIVSMEKVVQAIGTDPLIAKKLLRLANSLTYNPQGKIVSDLSAAIYRLGFQTVRTATLGVAMEQMLYSAHLMDVRDIAQRTWQHSLQVASIARVLSRHIGKVNAEDAMLAGIAHNMGILYLLYRTSNYPEYSNHREELLELVTGWHENIGETLQTALGLPEHITQAIRDHEHPGEMGNPQSLSYIIHLANQLGGGTGLNWLKPETAHTNEVPATLVRYLGLLRELEDEIRDVHQALDSFSLPRNFSTSKGSNQPQT